jgi:hypothetical protein
MWLSLSGMKRSTLFCDQNEALKMHLARRIGSDSSEDQQMFPLEMVPSDSHFSAYEQELVKM